MTRVTRWKFRDAVDLHDAEETLLLSILAAEGLFGEARLRMDLGYVVDESINVVAVDTSTQVGYAVAAIFTAFVNREFGPESFDVRHTERLF